MILARIQAHPDRVHLHKDLALALSPLPVETRLHSSTPPDPWAGYRACLSGIPRAYSHLLILQDDAQPVENFVPAVQAVAERHPEVPVCLFMGDIPATTALAAKRAKGRCYVPLGPAGFVPLIAVLWPREKAEDFLFWSENTTRRLTRADDGNAGRWMKETKQPFWVTVPSIVEHNDFVPSVKGGRDHKPGLESWRRALFLAKDAADYEW